MRSIRNGAFRSNFFGNNWASKREIQKVNSLSLQFFQKTNRLLVIYLIILTLLLLSHLFSESGKFFRRFVAGVHLHEICDLDPY